MTIIDDLKQLPELDYVIFDLETTGFSKDKDRIIEIAALRIAGGEVIDKYHKRVNPERLIPENVSKHVHGIYDKDVKGCPPIAFILPGFMKFLGKSILVAHNAKFDIGFLRANLLRLNMSVPFYPVIDTMGMFKKYFPGLKSYSQVNLAAAFDIKVTKAHSADDDCLVCFELLKTILSEAAK